MWGSYWRRHEPILLHHCPSHTHIVVSCGVALKDKHCTCNGWQKCRHCFLCHLATCQCHFYISSVVFWQRERVWQRSCIVFRFEHLRSFSLGMGTSELPLGVRLSKLSSISPSCSFSSLSRSVRKRFLARCNCTSSSSDEVSPDGDSVSLRCSSGLNWRSRYRGVMLSFLEEGVPSFSAQTYSFLCR